MRQAKRDDSMTRRVVQTTLDVAIGGTALAADKVVETVDKVTDRAGDVLRRGRDGVRERGEEMKQAVLDGPDTRPYEERTRDELYDLAAERNVDGRSSMDKAELIAALRAER